MAGRPSSPVRTLASVASSRSNWAGTAYVTQGSWPPPAADRRRVRVAVRHESSRPFRVDRLPTPSATRRAIHPGRGRQQQHAPAGRPLPGELGSRHRYHKWLAYGRSKFANLAFMCELQRRATAAGAELLAVGAHPEYDERPPNRRTGVAVDDAQLDPAADCPGHDGLGHKPTDAERDPRQQRRPLAARDPEQEPDRGAGVRNAWVGYGKVTHVTPG